MASTKIDEPTAPTHFYKYRPMSSPEAIERVEQILLRDEICFAPSSSFNDPFDLNPVFLLDASVEKQRDDFLRLSRKFRPDLSDEKHLAEADRVMKTSLSPSDIEVTTNTIQREHQRAMSTLVGTFCVSEKCDDLLVWAHYADSHRGVCLEFDGFGALMAHAQKVNYQSTRQPINPYVDDRDAMLTKALLTKSEHWNYEVEWRLLRVDEGPGLVRFRPNNLTGVVVGALATNETIRTLKNWASKRFVPLKMYRARTSNKEFKLLVDPFK